MLDYPIPNKKKEEEIVIPTILHNNHYHANIINTIQQKTQRKCQKRLMTFIVTRKRRMGRFYIVGEEVYHITKLFRKQNLGFMLKTKNNTGKSPEQKHRQTETPKIPKQWCTQTAVPGLPACLHRTDRQTVTNKIKEHTLAYKKK